QRRVGLDSYGVSCGSKDKLIRSRTVVTTSTVIWVNARSGAEKPIKTMVTTRPTAPLISTALIRSWWNHSSIQQAENSSNHKIIARAGAWVSTRVPVPTELLSNGNPTSPTVNSRIHNK